MRKHTSTPGRPHVGSDWDGCPGGGGFCSGSLAGEKGWAAVADCGGHLDTLHTSRDVLHGASRNYSRFEHCWALRSVMVCAMIEDVQLWCCWSGTHSTEGAVPPCPWVWRGRTATGWRGLISWHPEQAKQDHAFQIKLKVAWQSLQKNRMAMVHGYQPQYTTMSNQPTVQECAKPIEPLIAVARPQTSAISRPRDECCHMLPKHASGPRHCLGSARLGCQSCCGVAPG